MSEFRRDNDGNFRFSRSPFTPAAVLAVAETILAEHVYRDGLLEHPRAAADYARMKIATLPHEVFVLITLDTRHRVITWRELFRGTIDGSEIHPREVVRVALADNAAAVIAVHNHPSGVPEPSNADIMITRKLRDALALIDVRVIDHFIVSATETVSLAERGLI